MIQNIQEYRLNKEQEQIIMYSRRLPTGRFIPDLLSLIFKSKKELRIKDLIRLKNKRCTKYIKD